MTREVWICVTALGAALLLIMAVRLCVSHLAGPGFVVGLLAGIPLALMARLDRREG